MVDLLELKSVLRKPIETLSKGFKRRVGLAQALLHDPEVLILDEPTDGLDPNQKHHVRTLLREMAAEKAIIISTHILEEVDALCTRAIVIANGRIVADARPGELEARSSYHNAVALRLRGRPGRTGARGGRRRAPACSGSSSAAPTASSPSCSCSPRAAPRSWIRCAGRSSAPGSALDEMFVERGRLDEVFRELTRAA